VQAVSFTGGEPLLFVDDLVHLMKVAGTLGIPYIRTGTNGFLLKDAAAPDFRDRIHRLAEKISGTPVRNFWISIDSAAPDVHEEMRGFPGVINGIEKALPIFHQHGLYPSANLGINRNLAGRRRFAYDGLPVTPGTGRAEEMCRYYRKGFRRFFRFIIDLGFTIVNCCYPMSIEGETEADDRPRSQKRESRLKAVYAASATDDLVSFTAAEKTILFMALRDVIPAFRSRIRVFSPRCSLEALIRQYSGLDDGNEKTSFACHGGVDFFFIDARDGNTYPCGYRGNENLGKFRDLGTLPGHPDCRQCDWECFRDPSELAGPLHSLLHNPLSQARRWMAAPLSLKLWCQDLFYYGACDFFDGRRAPDYCRLGLFQG